MALTWWMLGLLILIGVVGLAILVAVLLVIRNRRRVKRQDPAGGQDLGR